MYLFIYLFINLFIYLFIYLCIYLLIFLFIHLFTDSIVYYTSIFTADVDTIDNYDNFNGVFLSSSNSRVRSQSLNVGTRVQTFERPGRSRNKSVSFDPEPKVCEFVEFSKKQLKKMRKHERKQTEIAAKKMEAAAKRAGGKNKGNDSIHCTILT